jgi:hypothetical protein
MSVNVNLKKIVIGIVVLVIIGGSIFWLNFTKETRAANAEYKKLVKFANRQAVEIAIIEQTSKLGQYKQQLVKIQQSQRNAVASNLPALASPPLGPSVVNPADPVDVE